MWNRLVNPTSTPEQPTNLPLVLTSFALHDLSVSQKKSGVVIPIIISSQHNHISCSALVDTGSPVTVLSKKIQRQLSLPVTPLKLHYHFLGATGSTLTTIGNVKADRLPDSMCHHWHNFLS